MRGLAPCPCSFCTAAREWRTTTSATFAELATETGRTVIHYDQIGCGNSTHLPDAPADFWTPALFVEEFHTVREALGIDEYHLLGQSWGGMLSAEIAVLQPSGLEVGGDLQLPRVDGALDGRGCRVGARCRWTSRPR